MGNPTRLTEVGGSDLNVGVGLQAHAPSRAVMAFNCLSCPLRDESRSFPKAEGFNPQGVLVLDDHRCAVPRVVYITSKPPGTIEWE